jgi:hypothetical protein
MARLTYTARLAEARVDRRLRNFPHLLANLDPEQAAWLRGRLRSSDRGRRLSAVAWAMVEESRNMRAAAMASSEPHSAR